MKNKISFILAVFFGSFFIWQSLDSKVLISEVKTFGVSSAYEEYVEIYNSSSTITDLTGWYLKKINNEGTVSSLRKIDGVKSINPFGYFLVAHQSVENSDQTYSTSSSMTSNTKGVLLFDGGDNLQDIVVWGFVSTSLYSNNPAPSTTETSCLARLPNNDIGNGQDTGDNSADFILTDCDPQNSLSLSRPLWEDTTSTDPEDPSSTSTDPEIPVTPTSTDPGAEIPTTTPTSTDPGIETPTSTPTSTIVIDTTTLWQNIKINEFVSWPVDNENEWVEFFNNNTSSLDLSGGYLCDSYGATSTNKCKNISDLTISALSFSVFEITSSFLNNTGGDFVFLRNPSGEEVDKVIYDGSGPKENQSYARKIDGQDTDDNSDWAITTSITKNSANTIMAPKSGSSGGGSGSSFNTTVSERSSNDEIFVTSTDYFGKVILNEIFPDPVGSDVLDEFIEIKNISSETVNLTGWTLSDTAKKYVLTDSLSPGQLAVYKREKTGISLNNSTPEEVKLADYSGKVVDSVSYKFAPEGQSYAKTASGTWAWTTEIMLGVENKVAIVDNLGITVNINSPITAEIGEIVIFDGSKSFDKSGGNLSFLWNFSDNLALTGDKVSREFVTSGIFSAKLTVTGISGETVDKTVNIRVGLGLTQTETGVIISEVFPNPEGVDKDEFIELYNSGSSTADLSDWKIENKNNKIFVIPAGTKIGSKSFLVFYQNTTKLTLRNESEKIYLLDENDEVADLIKYEKAPSGKSYSFYGDEGFWNKEPNPGRLMSNEEKNISISTATPKSGTAVKNYMIKNLSAARASEIGNLVITQGAVAVLPDIFGSQYFYIADNGVGLQIYSYKKDWPELKVGDLIKVKGEISQANGVKRIKTKSKADFTVLKKEAGLKIISSTLEKLNEENLGALIKITGEITSLKTNYLYLDDGNDEIQVYFKKNTGINKKNYKVGEVTEVTGILETANTGWQLWPRSADDLKKISEAPAFALETKLDSANGSKSTANNYLTATLGGFSALFFGFFLKNKRVVLKTALALAGKLIKRG